MLPEFLSDVSINISAVPAHLENTTFRGVLWQAAPGRFMIDVPETARYLVEEGKRVTIDPLPSAMLNRGWHLLSDDLAEELADIVEGNSR